MLSDDLLGFLVGLSQDEQKIALQAVSRFILLGDYKIYRESIKKLNKDNYHLFYKEVKEFLKSSFECRKVWRAVRYSLASGVSLSASSERFSAEPKSTQLVWGSLSADSQQAVRDSIENEESLGFLSREEFGTLVKSLDKFCGKVSYLRLRFLSDNDRAFDLVDLRSELLAHGVQVVRLYEHTRDIKKIENFAKASIQNYAINLIQHYTSESRACVTNATVGCGTCIFCLTDKPQKCSDAVADYRTTTLSLEGVPLQTLGKVRFDAEERMNFRSLVAFLKEGSGDDVSRVIDLAFGVETDDGFEEWLELEHKTSVDKLLSTPKKLVNLLCKYLDLSPKEVNSILRERYDNYRELVA